MYAGDSSAGRRSLGFGLTKDALSGDLRMLLLQALP